MNYLAAIEYGMNEIKNPQKSGSEERKKETHAWKLAVAKFQKPSALRSAWQVVNSLGSYVLLWLLMYLTLWVSVWLTLGLAILAAGFLVRIFIISHDCGHGSFFVSKRANTVIGFITGLLTFTPYQQWRWDHARHHAASGDLDKRGIGDVWTMTVHEYLDASRWKRIRYRLARHPVTLLVLAPLFLFLVMQRFSTPGAGKAERYSVYWTNLCIILMAGGLGWLFGWQNYVFIQLAISMISGAAGVWLFYVQHNFEGAYWERGDDWDFVTAALSGSSFYRLPKVLQWFSGNIGFHHIHHLSARIPNYNLESCHNSESLFQAVKPLTLWSSWRCFSCHLWDEESARLVGFRHLRTLRS